MITKFKLFEGSVKSAERIDIFRDNNYILVAPLTGKASMKYGAFTHWCTSVSDGIYMEIWDDEDNSPNSQNSDTIYLVLIRKNYNMTKRNKKISELYYILNKKEEDGEITKIEKERLKKLKNDDDFVNLSKICIIKNKKKGHVEAWSANNVNLEISNLYDLECYGLESYIIEKMENHIYEVTHKKLSLTENIQLANKVYFKTGELSEMDKNIILNITKGDNYTKFIADTYYHFKKFKELSDILKHINEMYSWVKDYDDNFFPVKDFYLEKIDKNTLNISDLFNALKERQYIVGFVREYFDRIYLRNIREDIKKPRNGTELGFLFDKMRNITSNLNMLKRINPEHAEKIFKKAFSSKNKTIDSVLQQLQDVKRFLVNNTTPNKIKSTIKKNCKTSKILSEKNDVMIILVDNNDDMVTLGNNTLWCFARDTNEFWSQYAIGGCVYIIIDFKQSVTNMYKFVVYLPSQSNFYDMYNELIQNVENYGEIIGIPDIYSLIRRMNN